MAKITIFDLDNKVIGYSGTYSEGVRDVFCQWGGIYVYGANGKVSNLYIWGTSASSYMRSYHD